MKTNKNLVTVLLVISAAIFFLVLPGCINGLTCEKGNGKIIKEERKNTNFSAVEISGAFNVIIKQDSISSVFVEADENLLPLITTKIDNNCLVVENKKSLCSSKDMNIYISIPEVNAISISGAVGLKSTNTLHSKELNVDVSGAGKITVDVELQKLNISCSGSGTMNLSGLAEDVDADISGATNINAFDLTAKKIKLSSSGAGKANVNVSENLEIKISGAATVNYKGNPSISQSISGAGNIHKVE